MLFRSETLVQLLCNLCSCRLNLLNKNSLLLNYYMSHISTFIELTRLKKPIGFMLLFWPCAWGLTIAYDFQSSIDQYLFYIN